MTFKTKFKIGQEVVYNGIIHMIIRVDLSVTEYSKLISYTLDNALGRKVVSQDDLIEQN